jgi:hypothetical protein
VFWIFSGAGCSWELYGLRESTGSRCCSRSSGHLAGRDVVLRKPIALLVLYSGKRHALNSLFFCAASICVGSESLCRLECFVFTNKTQLPAGMIDGGPVPGWKCIQSSIKHYELKNSWPLSAFPNIEEELP